MNPVLVSNWHSPAKYFNDFIRTARNNGIEPQNADPSDWGGFDWRQIQWWKKVEAQLRFVVEHPDNTHFAFTDSYDIVFAAGWDEITRKYEAYQSPIVFGTECYCWPKQEQAVLYPETPFRSKYLNAGFWMGERTAALALLEEAARLGANHDICDSTIFVNLFLSGKFPIKLDNSCSLLFCTNINSLDFLEPTPEGRPITKDSGQKPCIFHGNGSSPLNKVIEMLPK